MKAFKVILSFVITVSLVYALNRSWSGVPAVDSLPALGKFLDPFHGFWANAEKNISMPEVLTVPGLKGEVKVVYDSMLIPHIFATNDEDLYFTQGYVTASFRLWQMETMSRGASGRLSEILGARLLNYDRSQRRLGMVYGAQNALKSIESDPEVLKAMTAYTAGVNAFINTLNADNMPLEYKLLDYQPEEWTNFNVALLTMNLSQTLNVGEKDREMTMALGLFGKPVVDLLWPDNENPGDPIVDRPGTWKFNPIKLDSIPLAVPAMLAAVDGQEIDESSKDVGSNNWAISGSRTATGAPILCNDPHLNLNLPSLWFGVHLNAPGVNVMGGSIPGAPIVISGFNDSIAWGLTNAQRDAVDYYKIQFKDASMNEYFSDGSWKATRKVIEEIVVKGKEPFYDTVTYTHHGPVTYDPSFRATGIDNLNAFRWLSHFPNNEVGALYHLNRAHNFDEYVTALGTFSFPAHNIAFASVQGDIGIRVQGKFPVRRKDEGKFVLDGTITSTEPKAFIPFEQNAWDKNPARGFISSANQYPADATYPYYINAQSYEAYRNRRINQVLGSLVKATVQDVMDLQSDNYNLKAAESLPYFLSNLDSTSFTPAEATAWQVLKSWDYYNSIESTGASYYEAWWDAMMPLAWDELDNGEQQIDRPTAFTTITLLKEQPALPFFDIRSTSEKETAREVLRKSFKLAVEDVEKWKTERHMDPQWADFKGTTIRSLLQLDPFSVRVRYGGNHDIVNATTRGHGPSWRMVVSLEKEGVKAWGVYPGGQSGNTGSTYYANMIPLWTNGKYVPLQLTAADKINGVIATTTFKPEE